MRKILQIDQLRRELRGLEVPAAISAKSSNDWSYFSICERWSGWNLRGAKAMVSHVVKLHQGKVPGDLTPVSKVPKSGKPW